jgi:hypothetical protein
MIERPSSAPRLAGIVAGICTCLVAPAAVAYVGPGAGLGVLGAMLAILAAVLATVVGLVLWPLRMIMRRKRRNAATSSTEQGLEAHRR